MQLSWGTVVTVITLSFAQVNAADEARHRERVMQMHADEQAAQKKMQSKLYAALHADKYQQYARNYRANMTEEQKERTKESKRESSSKKYRADMEILDNLEKAKAQAVTFRDVERIAAVESRAAKKKESTAKWLEKNRSDESQRAVNRVNSKVRKIAKIHVNEPMTESEYTKKINGFVSWENGLEGPSEEKLRTAAWKTWNSFKPRGPYQKHPTASSSSSHRKAV